MRKLKFGIMLRSTFYNLRSNQGFTLIEALIYIALFSIVIGGGIGTAFYIAQGTQNVHQFILRESEANFILRKIDWALNQADSVSVVDGDLVVSTDTGTLTFEKVGGVINLNGEKLTGSAVTINFLSFDYVSGTPGKLETEMIINGKNFGPVVRYIR